MGVDCCRVIDANFSQCGKRGQESPGTKLIWFLLVPVVSFGCPSSLLSNVGYMSILEGDSKGAGKHLKYSINVVLGVIHVFFRLHMDSVLQGFAQACLPFEHLMWI